MRRWLLLAVLLAAGAESVTALWPGRDQAAVPAAATTTVAGGDHLVQIGTFTSPTAIVSAPGDPRLFVVQQTGQIRIVDASGATLASPFLDLSGVVTNAGPEEGLLGLAFPPDYATSGLFYVYFTGRDSGDIHLQRFHVSSDPNVADALSGVNLMTIDHSQARNHNGGELQFGPDGYLYIGVGDGGGAGGTQNHQQDPTSKLGKLLRIDPTTYPTGSPPPGQPISAGADPAVYAIGLRNPWRFSFDPANGNLIIGDVGQDTWEEVDDMAAGTARGKNFGWNLCEGTHPFGSPGGSVADCLGQTGLYVAPVWDYKHTEGCSITGGYVVHDAGLGALDGKYLFGDYCAGTIWAMTPLTSGRAGDVVATGLNVPDLSTFGVDASGRIYVASGDGPVYRLEGVNGTPGDQAPVASFTVSPSPAGVGASVSLDGTASHDPDGTIDAYGWDTNGDGKTDVTGRTAKVTFSTAGTVTIRLTVTDDAGVTGATTRQLVVQPAAGGGSSGTRPAVHLSGAAQQLKKTVRSGLAVSVRSNRPVRVGLSAFLRAATGRRLGLHVARGRTLAWIGSIATSLPSTRARLVRIRFNHPALAAFRRHPHPGKLTVTVVAILTDHAGLKSRGTATLHVTG